MDITYRRGLPHRIASRALAVPDKLVQRLAGDPVQVDGRVLNRSLQFLLEMAERGGRNGSGGSVEERRAEISRSAPLGMPVATDLHVNERVIPGPESDLRVRIYRPFGTGATPPAIVFFHGGGWVVGDLDTHDGSCRVLAIASRCVVVSVDYRLAPEHPFPAAPNDCLAAYRWVVDNASELDVDARAVAVAGDSAGGNLAAVVAQSARDAETIAPVAQGLIYPATDFRMQSRSIELFAEGFFLTRESMDWFSARYLPDHSQHLDPLASPLLAADVDGLAPAWVWTAGFDPLRDEGRAYADRLDKAGIETHYRCYDDLIHGFFSMGVIPGGLAIIEDMGREFGELIRASAAAR